MSDPAKSLREKRPLGRPVARSWEVGLRHGWLTITEIRGAQGGVLVVDCDCGVTKTLKASTWLRVRSCGCKHAELARLNQRPAQFVAERRIWSQMRQRCSRPTHHAWHLYGGRGIKVCERWLKFENFLADMGPRPSPDLSVDRRDPNGDYEPSNCRWATWKEQNRNRRNNRLITHQGTTLTLAGWADRCGLNMSTLWARLNSGWSLDKALRARAA